MESHGFTIQMKPLQQYFHMVLSILCVVLPFKSGMMESYDATIEMKLFWQHNCIESFISLDFAKRNLIFFGNSFFGL